MDFIQVDFTLAINHVIHLFAAYLLAVPLGWDREKSGRHFGLRTFPLVAVVTCGFMLIGMSVIDSTDGEARIFQGIIVGIGFIGGGAIVTDQDKVTGTASAASIWNTGAIGLAVAFDRYEIALVLSLINLFTLMVFPKVKKTINEGETD
ncbi:MAG: MgtC/SapB family protein [Desulforhopalus sp.]